MDDEVEVEEDDEVEVEEEDEEEVEEEDEEEVEEEDEEEVAEEEEEEVEEELEEEGHGKEDKDDDGAWLDGGLSRTLSSALPHDDAPNTKDTKSIPQPSIASQTVLSFTGRGRGGEGRTAGAGRCKDSRHPILRMSRTRSKAFEFFRFLNSSCTGDS